MSADWMPFEVCTEPNKPWDAMLHIFISTEKEIAPMVTISKVDEKDPWIKSDILSMIRERDELKAKSDHLIINENFALFKKKRIKAKRHFIASRLKNADANPRIYWVELKSVFRAEKNLPNH